jgi:DNA replication protein DnaD
MIPGIGIMNPKFKIRNGLLNGLVHLCEFNESSGNAIEEVLDNNGINNNISYQQSTVSNLTYSYLLNGSSSDINFGNINNFEYSDPVTFGI